MAIDVLLIGWLLVHASGGAQSQTVQACESKWVARGLQGRPGTLNAVNAEGLRTAAIKIARDLDYIVEKMRIEIVDLGDAFAVYFAPVETGALGGDLTVIFTDQHTICVIRGL